MHCQRTYLRQTPYSFYLLHSSHFASSHLQKQLKRPADGQILLAANSLNSSSDCSKLPGIFQVIEAHICLWPIHRTNIEQMDSRVINPAPVFCVEV
jgi:hypothetical protein